MRPFNTATAATLTANERTKEKRKPERARERQRRIARRKPHRNQVFLMVNNQELGLRE